jgi:hypothetical protein
MAVAVGIALVFLLAAVMIDRGAFALIAPSGGADVTGTVTESGNDIVVVAVSGAPQAGKLNGTTIRARVTDETAFSRGLSRKTLPGPGVPVTITVQGPPASDGTYRALAVRASVR